ncbi:MAG: hypothetical protein AB7T63_07275 [Planctomycetota bacterium]
MQSVLRLLPSFLGPGLLLFLVSVQIACGMDGFESGGGLLGLLEVPGVLLGWGGVALLLPLLTWLLLDWWGYSPSGFALKSLGGLALGIAVGGLGGLMGGKAGGGLVGADLAAMLADNLGSAFAIFALLLMAVPAGILSFAKLGVGTGRSVAPSSTTTPARPRREAHAPSSGDGPAAGASAWLSGLAARMPRRRPKVTTDLEALARRNAGGRARYPRQQFDDQGNELPMAFEGSRDVGVIRFADGSEPDPAAAPARVSPPRSAPVARDDGLPTLRDVLSGQADVPASTAGDEAGGGLEAGAEPGEAGDDTDAMGAASSDEPTYDDIESEFDEEDGPIHVDAHGRPVPRPKPTAGRPAEPANTSKVRGRPARGPELRDSRDDAPAADVVHLPEAGPPASVLLARDRTQNDAEALPPGVRFADEPAPAPTEETSGPARRPSLSAEASTPRSTTSAPAPTAPEAAGEPVLEALKGTTAQRVAIQKAEARDPETRAEEMRAVRSSVRRTLAPVTDEGADPVHLRKLEACGLFEPTTAPGSRGSSPPSGAAPTAPLASWAAKADRVAESGPRVEAARLAAQKALVHELKGEGRDPLFADAVEVALSSGAVSAALLARRLATSQERARELLRRLLATDVVGAPGPSGTCATVLTRTVWDEIRG